MKKTNQINVFSKGVDPNLQQKKNYTEHFANTIVHFIII